MANIFEQDFGQLPSGPAMDYADLINPRAQQFANAPAGAKPDMFERAGFKAPSSAGGTPGRDMFDDAGFSMPGAKPPAPTPAATPSIADVKPGLDEKGHPGWFVEDPARPGRHLQVVPSSMFSGGAMPTTRGTRASPGASGQAAGSPIAQTLMAGDNPLALGQKDYAPLGPVPPGKAAALAGTGAAVGLTAPFWAPELAAAVPALGRGVLGVGRAGLTLAKYGIAEKAIEALIPPEYQPGFIRMLSAIGEAH